MSIFGCASDEQFRDELNEGFLFSFPVKSLKSYSDLSFIGKLIFKLKNRKILKQLKALVNNHLFLETHPRLDESTKEYIDKWFSNSSKICEV